MKRNFSYQLKITGGKYHNVIMYTDEAKNTIQNIKRLWTFNVSDRCVSFELTIYEDGGIIWQRVYLIKEKNQAIQKIKELTKQ